MLCLKDYCLQLDVKRDIEVHDDGLLDYLLMGGSLTLVLGTIVIITTGMCIFYCRKRRKGN